MSQATISIRVDKSLKTSFDALCDAFGLSTSAAFNIFMKAVVRERRIPFAICADAVDDTRKAAMAAIESMRLSAAERGITQMTIDEINAEIKASRDEKKDFRHH